MDRTAKHLLAIKLRKKGKTYPYISRLLIVNKSTLFYWFKNINLTPEQIEKIKKDKKQKQIEAYNKTIAARRKRITQLFFEKEQKALGKMAKRDFLIAGLFLYLGEGSKTSWSKIAISNSDPRIIKFGMFWLTKILKIPPNKVHVGIHLYTDMDIKKEILFWSKITGLSKKCFFKPYIKKSSSKRINHPTFGHGTCNIIAYNVNLKHKIMAGIDVIISSAIGRVAQW